MCNGFEWSVEKSNYYTEGGPLLVKILGVESLKLDNFLELNSATGRRCLGGVVARCKSRSD